MSVHRKGEQRLVDVPFAPAAAMALDVTVPPAVEGTARGGGRVPAPSRVPPSRAGRSPSGPTRAVGSGSRGAPRSAGTQEGPPVFDVQTRSLHPIEDGLIRSRVVRPRGRAAYPRVRARPGPAARPWRIRAVGGKGVTGSARSEDRARLRVELADERAVGSTITLDGETPYQPAATSRCRASCCPRPCATADRSRSDFESGVEAHDVRVEGGRRLASQPRRARRRCSATRWPARDGGVAVDLLPADLRLEASSTYYLNLTEPAKSLLAAVTYRVRQGTAFRLTPRFPSGYGLRSLTVNGQRTGFAFDQRSDGTVEVRLERGVPEGQRDRARRRAGAGRGRLGARDGHASAARSPCPPPARTARRASSASVRTPRSASSTPP